MIECPTPAQRLIFGERRRRIPELWDVDNALMAGIVQNQDAYMQSVAAQRPFFFDHIDELAARAFREFAELTGRGYHPVMPYRCEDAEYLIVCQGSAVPSAEAVADYLRETRRIRVGVVNMLMFRPFPAPAIARLLKGTPGRRRARAHRPAAGGGPAADARNPRDAGQVPGERQAAARPAVAGAGDLPRSRRAATAVLRRLRPGQPRPATRGADRRDREHAARALRSAGSTTCRSTSCTPRRARPRRRCSRRRSPRPTPGSATWRCAAARTRT
jgi:hypothetical protein